ncbi:RNA-binding S4 domain-containing protein [Acholeplasma sp. OttesenSCG-928-E16]|nr:RNA-binding S4 domain-containing protein [Acholeplasma sp. OttesenSCG-928-E16]
MKSFKLHTEYITMTQFLKANDYISSGGEAKFFLLENKCYINNELCKERGKKIFPNYKVKINDDLYKIEQ